MPLPEDDLEIGAHPALADINVTPVIDVMLVLLVIFMVTAPLLVAGISVDLPRAGQTRPVTARPPIVVTVTRDGKVLLGSDEIAFERLVATVRERLADSMERTVFIRGDRETNHGNIVFVIDRLTEAGLGKVVMLVERTRTIDPAGKPR